MASKIYPVFIKFIVPVREVDRFESNLKDISTQHGINDDLIYFSHYTQEKLQEIEYFAKIDVPTGSQKLMEQHLNLVNEILNSPLKNYHPTYTEEPNLRK